MAFDPSSTIGSIADNQADPLEARAKAMTLRDMSDRGQLNQLQLNAAREEAADSARVKEILKNSDYTTPEGLAKTAAAVNRVSPRASMDLLKQGQQYQSGQIQQQLDQYTLAEKKTDLIIGTLDPIIAEARQLKNNGGSDLDVNALIAQRVPQALQQLRQAGPDGKPVLADEALKRITAMPFTLPTLESLEAQSKQYQGALKQRLEQFKADTQAKRADETERHNKAEEDRQAKIADQKRLEASEGIISDDSAQLAVDRILNGESARDVLANFGRGKQGPGNIAKVQNLLASTAKARGIDAAEITARNLELKGLAKEQQTEASIAGKISYAEKEIAQIGPKVLELSAQVPRGEFVPWNRLKQYDAKQLSDPKLKQLKAYLTTLSNSYDVLGGRGGTDVEKRAHNRELLDSADSPEALKAAVDAITAEAALSHQAANESMTVDRDRLRGNPPASGAELKPGSRYLHPSGATVEILDK